MQPVGWMTHSISPYCTFLVIVPCGCASCTGRRILFEAAKIKKLIIAGRRRINLQKGHAPPALVFLDNLPNILYLLIVSLWWL